MNDPLARGRRGPESYESISKTRPFFSFFSALLTPYIRHIRHMCRDDKKERERGGGIQHQTHRATIKVWGGFFFMRWPIFMLVASVVRFIFYCNIEIEDGGSFEGRSFVGV